MHLPTSQDGVENRDKVYHHVGQYDESGKDYTTFPLSADSATRVFRKATLVVKG